MGGEKRGKPIVEKGFVGRKGGTKKKEGEHRWSHERENA